MTRTNRAEKTSTPPGRWKLMLGSLKTGLPVAVRGGLIRLTTLIVDYLLVVVTAFLIIPTLGAWSHEASGAASGSITIGGTIALWIVPFVFVVVMITVAEIALMRWLWRAGGRIEKMKRVRLGDFDVEALIRQSRTNMRTVGTAPFGQATKKKKLTTQGSKA